MYLKRNELRFLIDVELSGYHRDLASVTEYCHEVAVQKFEDDQRREKEQTVAKYVQWKEKQGDGSLCDYDPVLNYQIELQYKEMNSDPQIDIAESDAIVTYKLDFSHMKIVRKDGKEKKAIIREELATSASKGKACHSVCSVANKQGIGKILKFNKWGGSEFENRLIMIIRQR